MNKNKLFCGDCLSILPTLPAESVDCVIADPPYGTTRNPWDVVIPFKEMWREVWRVCKEKAAVVFTAQLPFGSDLIQSQRNLFRYDLVYEKNISVGFLNALVRPLSSHENILVFCRVGRTTYNAQYNKGSPYSCDRGPSNGWGCYGQTRATTKQNEGTRCPRSVLYFERDKDIIHHTQKPIALMKWLVKTYSNRSETVLDFCMGSGSTGVAAALCGRSFIGIERDEKFFSLASERIARAELDYSSSFLEALGETK